MDKKQTTKYVLTALKKAGASMSECRITDTVKTELYYETGKIGLMRTNFNTVLSIKAIKDMRKGTVSLNSVKIEDIDRAVCSIMTAIESATPDEAEGISDIIEDKSFQTGISEPDKEAMYDSLTDYINQVRVKYPKISFNSITIEHDYADTLYVNTNGVSLSAKRGLYSFSPMFMACDGDKSSSFNYSGMEFLKFNKPLLNMGMNERLISESEKQIDTKVLDGKFTGDIIITPNCLDGVLYDIESNFLSDSVLINGTSLFKNSLGKQVAAPIVTIMSCPEEKELPGGSFITHDGYIAKNMPIIENGIFKNFVLSRYGAKKTGNKRSVSAGGNYIVNAGDTSLDEMIKGVKKGLLLNRFSGGAPGANGDITGVAKNSFLIEDGKITDALSEVMISGNLASLLMDVKAISKERINNGDSILPWMKVGNFVISGK